jgi:hypothetical protein
MSALVCKGLLEMKSMGKIAPLALLLIFTQTGAGFFTEK